MVSGWSLTELLGCESAGAPSADGIYAWLRRVEFCCTRLCFGGLPGPLRPFVQIEECSVAAGLHFFFDETGADVEDTCSSSEQGCASMSDHLAESPTRPLLTRPDTDLNRLD